MDTNVRVLVANGPRLIRELVLSTLSEQAGIRVVGEAKNEQDVPSLVAQTKPDFLLIGLDESHKRPALCDLLLREFPALSIIAVAPRSGAPRGLRSVARWRDVNEPLPLPTSRQFGWLSKQRAYQI